MDPGVIGEFIATLGVPGAAAYLCWHVFLRLQKSWNENNEKMAAAQDAQTTKLIEANREQNAITREDQRARDEVAQRERELARQDFRLLLEQSNADRAAFVEAGERTERHMKELVQAHHDYRARTEALLPAARIVQVFPEAVNASDKD